MHPYDIIIECPVDWHGLHRSPLAQKNHQLKYFRNMSLCCCPSDCPRTKMLQLSQAVLFLHIRVFDFLRAALPACRHKATLYADSNKQRNNQGQKVLPGF